MKIAIVIVHYHTPRLLAPAVDALRRDAEASGLELEGVVVDNGSRPEDRALMEALPFRRLSCGDNLGYAGGANLGLRATSAELAVVMNPDVEVLTGCLSALVEALCAGTAVAAPRFYWDAERRFQLPPTERIGYSAELGRLMAERNQTWCRVMRRRWRRHNRRFFTADKNLVSYDLSGALLALRRDAWQQVGPLDEGYRLYFEETDWLQRMKRAGRRCRFVAAAEAVHLYAQSTVHEGRAEQWFEDSQRRFRRRFYGAAFSRALEGLAVRLRRGSKLSPELSSPETALDSDRLPATASWLEVAADAKGFPAAVRRLDASDHPLAWSQALPQEIRQRMAPGGYFLRTVAGDGRELTLNHLEIPHHPPRETASRLGSR